MISKMAVLGAGVMGSEIAQAAAAGGVEVVLFDTDPAALARGLAHIESIGARRVERGRMSAEDAQAILDRIATSESADAVGDCDLAIEAVPEVMHIKQTVFGVLDAALPRGAILASNTSGLSISELAAGTGRPDRVVGMHFFNPASVMKLVEVIRGDTTSEQTLQEAEALATALGKVPVRVRECPGFLVNRILVRAMVEAYAKAEELQADMPAADAAVVQMGPAPMGAFALGDLIGLDTMGHIQVDLQRAYGERFADGGQIARQVEAGRLGSKSGAGFFDGRAPQGEPDDDGRAVASAYYEGALDEALLCVGEGIAAQADTDTAMRFGCGWSQGPLEWDAAGRPAADA